MSRYYKQRPQPEPPLPFAWDKAYKNRTERLSRLVSLKAPESIIEMECRSVLKSITRHHNSFWTLFRWARHDFHSWRSLAWFGMQWDFHRYVLRWDHERCEKYFFGEYEERP